MKAASTRAAALLAAECGKTGCKVERGQAGLTEGGLHAVPESETASPVPNLPSCCAARCALLTHEAQRPTTAPVIGPITPWLKLLMPQAGFGNEGRQGVVVLLPAGRYVVTQTIEIKQSNVVVRGEGVSAGWAGRPLAPSKLVPASVRQREAVDCCCTRCAAAALSTGVC